MEDFWKPYSEPEKLSSSEFVGETYKDSKILIATMNIRPTKHISPIPNISNLLLVNKNEAKTFQTAKRAEEHATGRYLLEYALRIWDKYLDLSQVEIKREIKTRRPFLSWIEGTYQGKKLPEFSISHSEGMAIIALCGGLFSIGIDIEPLNQERSENLMEFVSGGDELNFLKNQWNQDVVFGTKTLNTLWTLKESVMKAVGIGMGINPISIEIPSKIMKILPIEKSNFQLEYLGSNLDIFQRTIGSDNPYSLSIAIRNKSESELPQLTQVEQEMIDALNSSNNIGCSNN